MGLFSVGEAGSSALATIMRRPPAKSGAIHRTGAPVLRGSVEAGSFEESFYLVPGKGETDRLLHAARRTLDAARRLKREARAGERLLSAAERQVARLTAAAVRVYEEILTLARLNKGRVFPSYDYLAEATQLGRATIGRALNTLEAIGFLVRQRRFERVKGASDGPRYKQTSNAYRPLMPAIAKRFLPRWMKPAPVPDDAAQYRADQDEQLQTMVDTLSSAELAHFRVGGELGKVLARLGASIDRISCEDHFGAQPLTESIQ